jgi:hypothetical protein
MTGDDAASTNEANRNEQAHLCQSRGNISPHRRALTLHVVLAARTIHRKGLAIAVAGSIGLLSMAAAEGPTTDGQRPAAVQPGDAATTPVADAAKGLTSAGGRVDGYLAGGRWREGTKLVDVQGQFRLSNERITFISVDGKSRFTCLENLTSERVARIVAESPETLAWIVQGTITEFRSENYLLLTQTVIRSHQTREPRESHGPATEL